MNFLRAIFEKLYKTDAGSSNSPDDQPYFALPGSRQWSPGKPQRVNKEKWKSCPACDQKIPVRPDTVIGDDGQPELTGTWTGVCPFCGACHVGTPEWGEDNKRQTACFECGTKLGELYQCPTCSFPRRWMRVDCPHCGKRHPVPVPHWVDHCDMFTLECAHCESVFISLCIC